MMVTEAEASQALGSPDRIINWARQAGRIAMRDFKKVDPRLKPDQTIVTQADLEIERFLAERILTVNPSHNLIGEEGNWNRLTSSPFTWVIDPIDGTTVFSQGLPGWGVSIGLLVNGQPYFGLFYMPLLNDLVYAIRQRGVFCDADDLTHTVRRKRRPKDFVAVSAGTHRNYRLASYNTRALGSIGASLMYTSRGVALGAFIPKARLWDLASGAVILAEAGGDLRYLSGQSIDYAQLVDGRLAPEPLIAGHPDILPDLQRAIAEI